jgi:hypothetical protein
MRFHAGSGILWRSLAFCEIAVGRGFANSERSSKFVHRFTGRSEPTKLFLTFRG